MPLLDQVLFSVAANAAVLGCVMLLRAAPPRVLVFASLAGMLMIAVPWGSVGGWLSSNGIPGATLQLVRDPEAAAGLPQPLSGPAGAWGAAEVLVGVWVMVAVLWLGITFASAYRTRRRWRARGRRADAVAVLALARFRGLAANVDIYRLPDSGTAMATGLIRREIWLGDRIADAHLPVALNHELCHLSAGDHYLVHLIAVVERLLWWNPLTWLLGRIARRHLEYACDQRCKQDLGERRYRRMLAEMALDRMPVATFPRLTIGSRSGIVERMERLTMSYRVKPVHVSTLIGLGAGLALASASLAGAPDRVTLIDCNDRLPKGVHYRLEISTDVSTHDGNPSGELSVSLRDPANPDSEAIPEGAGPYVRCVMGVVGAGAEDLPEGV